MRYVVTIMLLFAIKIAVSQPAWDVVGYTNSTTAYFTITIDGEPAGADDLLGAYVGDECRGIGEVVINGGVSYVAMQIQGDIAETVSFRIWDQSISDEIFVSTTAISNPGGSIGLPPGYIQINASSSNTNPFADGPGWKVVNYTNSTVVYCIVTVNGEPAGEGDLVGAFVKNECRGTGNIILYEGSAYATIQIQGLEAEEVNFRIWDSSEAEGLNVSAFVTSNPGGILGLPPDYIVLDGAQAQLYPISEIQGNAGVSPYEGQIVEVSGAVTAIDDYGYYIQDNSAEWSGIYIYNPENTGIISIGSIVKVKGVVYEYNGLTELTSVSGFNIVSSDLEIVPIEVGVITEAYESVLVKITGRADNSSSGTANWTVTSESLIQYLISLYFYGEYSSLIGYNYKVTGIVYDSVGVYMVEPRIESDIENLSESNGIGLLGTGINVFPNPFNEFLNVSGVDQFDEIKISTLEGKIVKNIIKPACLVETCDLPPGDYIISVLNDNVILKVGLFQKEK